MKSGLVKPQIYFSVTDFQCGCHTEGKMAGMENRACAGLFALPAAQLIMLLLVMMISLMMMLDGGDGGDDGDDDDD